MTDNSNNTDTRIAAISILIEDKSKADEVNRLLHDYSAYIIGRLGLPYPQKNVSIICVIIDAPTTVTSALSGKLGMIRGVSSKTNTSKF